MSFIAILGSKHFLVKKDCGSKKSLNPKKFEYEKIGSKYFWVKTIFLVENLLNLKGLTRWWVGLSVQFPDMEKFGTHGTQGR